MGVKMVLVFISSKTVYRNKAQINHSFRFSLTLTSCAATNTSITHTYLMLPIEGTLRFSIIENKHNMITAVSNPKRRLIIILSLLSKRKYQNTTGGNEMEEKICYACNKRYSLYNVTVGKQENLPICMYCLRDKLENGEILMRDKERVETLEKIASSISNEQNNQVVAVNNNPGNKTENPVFTLQFGFDLTQKARENKIDPLIGREAEIEKTLRIMKRRYKNNPILTGEPGVGKTAIVEGIALKIANGEVTEDLKNKKIISLSVANLIAGTKFRGEFEERMKKIIDELRERDDVILFLDEFHTIVSGGGSDGTLNAAQILKPALSRGEIQIIGATTIDEYRTHIEQDKALERRFQKVNVEEPNLEDCFKIIQGVKNKYESYHGIIIPDEAVEDAIILSKRYITDRMLPDKAIDLIDEACAHKKMFNSKIDESIQIVESELTSLEDESANALANGDFLAAKAAVQKEKTLNSQIRNGQKHLHLENVISSDDLTYILQQWTGIPAQKITKKEAQKLKTFPSDMRLRVKGQDKAIEALAKAIKRSQVGLKDENRPVGTFMMLGPTGVGKTEMTKALTEILFGSEDKMIRIDMSEYMEKHSVSKLIGSPPGYVGYEDEGKLIKEIRTKPYSVVLFDEIEKAHPDIVNILLQLFDEGRITSAKGRTVDARNVIFIMTSNVGSDLYISKKKSLGYNTSDESTDENLDKKIRERLKEQYKPEFLNRIDDFLIFNKLSEENMTDIAQKWVDELKTQLATKSIEAKISKSVVEFLAKKGYDPELGARPLRRQIDELKNLLADEIIDKDLSNVTVTVKEDKIIIK